jgi:hypothetical protein
MNRKEDTPGFSAPVGERDTARNNENRRVENLHNENGAKYGSGPPHTLSTMFFLKFHPFGIRFIGPVDRCGDDLGDTR